MDIEYIRSREQRYLKSTERYDLLSREEDKEIALRYKKDGNSRDAQKLIVSNLRYVVRVASGFSIRHKDVDKSDLIQEGNLGLIAALENFDPDKGFKLITFADSWIKSYIQKFIAKNSVISSGATRHKHNQYFTKKTGGTEILDDIDIDTFEEHNTHVLKYDCDEVDKLAEKNWLKSVHHVLDTANEKDRFIIDNRLISYNPIKLDEVATHFNISRSGAHALETRIKNRLKKKFLINPDIMDYIRG